MVRLRAPTPGDEAAVMAYRQAFLDWGDSLDRTANLRRFEDYTDWYAAVRDNRCQDIVRPGLVPATTLLAVVADGRLVGMLDIRHKLNDYLMRVGGILAIAFYPLSGARAILARCWLWGWRNAGSWA